MIEGLDISEFQWPVDYTRVNAKFVWIRAHSGYRPDKHFTDHWNGLRGRTKRGAYHYLVADTPLNVQLNGFFATVPGNDRGELPPMLDVENTKSFAALTIPSRVNVVTTALAALDKWYGAKTVLYTYPDFMSEWLKNDPRLKPWWLDWSNLGNNVPPPWPLTVDQYAVKSGVAGFNGPVDCDRIADSVFATLLGGEDWMSDPVAIQLLQEIADNTKNLLSDEENFSRPSNGLATIDGHVQSGTAQLAALNKRIDQLLATQAAIQKKLDA